MVIELPQELESVLQAKAELKGVSLTDYVCGMLSRDLDRAELRQPLKNSRGILAKYGPAPSAEEIDENSRDIWRGFGESF